MFHFLSSLSFQLARGVAFMHENWVLHRDLKPSNLLIAGDARLSIADFGLARQYGGQPEGAVPFTSQVVTRWYRAPELLFGARHYGWAVDAWAVGCVFAEMLLRGPLFPGETDVDQLSKIVYVMGSIDEQQWPGVSQLPDYVTFPPRAAFALQNVFPAADAAALDLIKRLLTLDPRQRIALGEALEKHAYFATFTPAQRADAQAAAATRVQQLPSSHSRGAVPKAGGTLTKRAIEHDSDDDGDDAAAAAGAQSDALSEEEGAEHVRKRLAL